MWFVTCACVLGRSLFYCGEGGVVSLFYARNIYDDGVDDSRDLESTIIILKMGER